MSEQLPASGSPEPAGEADAAAAAGACGGPEAAAPKGAARFRVIHRFAESLGLAPGELRWASVAAALIMALTCLPYLFGWYLRPGDFMGHVYNADDANVHLAWMRQAAEGRWLFTDRFTSEAQQPQFTHILFVKLGRIAGHLGGSYQALILVYHAARIFFGWKLLVLVYLFAAYLFPDRATRRLALLATGLSSGLGWLMVHLLDPTRQPHDYSQGLVMPEAVTFLSIYIFPLFAASMALIVLLYLLALRAFDTGRVWPAVGAGVCGLALGHIHTYDILPVYGVLGAYVLALGLARRAVPWREAGLAMVIVLLSLPSPLYQYFVFQGNEVFQRKALTRTLSPDLLRYALTFGLVLPAALAGAVLLKRIPNRHGAFLVVWATVTVAMSYAPVSFQRKMIEGAHIPLAILAAAGWIALGSRVRVPRRAWAAALVLATVPSNLAQMGLSVQRLISNNAEAAPLPPYYLDADERAALDWLRANARPEDVVLSGPLVGCYMPPYAGATTYVSHWAETIDFGRKFGEMMAFCRGITPDVWRAYLLKSERIRYVYWGDAERVLGERVLPGQAPPAGGAKAFDPSQAPYLRSVFIQGHVAIYEVVAR